MAERLPSSPTALGAPGRRLWRRLVREYVFDIGQLELLARACAVEDRLGQIGEIMVEGPLVLDRAGAVRSNPLLGVERDLRGLQLRYFRALGLHEDDREAPERYDNRRRQLAAHLGHQRARGRV